MTEPLVSVFVPTYNHRPYIREAVLSAVEQDYPHLQVVVGDDGSSDGTADEVAELAATYPDRVTAVLGPHVGLPGNCNRVLDACRGEYIAFFSGDDVLLPGKIRRQVEWFAADRRRMICGHDIDVFDSDTGDVLYRWSRFFDLPKSGHGASRLVRVGYVYPGPSLMIRTEALHGSRFDDRFGLMSDWKFWIDVFSAADGEYGSIDGVFARYRRHATSITSDDRTFDSRLIGILMTLGMLEATRPELFRECRCYRARIFLRAAGARLRAGDRAAARAYLLAALRAHPLSSWKVPAALVVSLLPAGLSQRLVAQYVSPTKI